MTFYSREKLHRLLKLKIEWRHIMTKLYEKHLDNLITSHEEEITRVQNDIIYYASFNVDTLISYYEGRIVSLQSSLKQLRHLRKILDK